ncbi:hypothetical protein SALBM311S_06431 [Streptomyces alboniger]
MRAEARAEKRAIDEAVEEAREEDPAHPDPPPGAADPLQARSNRPDWSGVRPRTLISFIAGAIGAYFLLTQLTHIEFGPLVANAEWGWVAAAVLFSAASYFAAAMALLGFAAGTVCSCVAVRPLPDRSTATAEHIKRRRRTMHRTALRNSPSKSEN